ncbi:MAG: O-methyltransferase [Actinomycetota bacterium]|nr:O-methyltransferase [Actinomycetota bacterium]
MIVSPAVEAYLSGLVPEPDSILTEMQEHGRRDRIPIVHATTGMLLEVLAAATGARRAVEVGTAIGVSTLHLARGGAHVTSFEVDPERHAAARDYLGRAGLADRVDLRLQDASEGLAELEGGFDLGFIDGPKNLYGDHLEQVVGLLRTGGLLLVDNVLISGAAATREPIDHWDAQSIEQMRAFNARLVEHAQLHTTLTPVGDGVALSVRQ